MGVLNDYANAAAVNAALNKGVEASKAVSELKEDLVKSNVTINVTSITNGKFIQYNGTVGSDQNSAITDYISVYPNTNIKVSNYYLYGRRSICAYDANKQYITTLLTDRPPTETESKISIPPNCYFIRITSAKDIIPTAIYTNVVPEIMIKTYEDTKKLSEVTDDLISGLSYRTDDINDIIKNNKEKANVIPFIIKETTINGVTITKNDDGTYHMTGTATNDFNFVFSDYIYDDIGGKECIYYGNHNGMSLYMYAYRAGAIRINDSLDYFKDGNVFIVPNSDDYALATWITKDTTYDVTFSFNMYEGDVSKYKNNIVDYNNKLDENINNIKEDLIELEVTDIGGITMRDGFVHITSGVIETSSSYSATNFINVIPKSTVLLKNSVIEGNAGICGYSITKEFITNLTGTFGGNGLSIEIPEHVHYIRVSAARGKIVSARYVNNHKLNDRIKEFVFNLPTDISYTKNENQVMDKNGTLVDKTGFGHTNYIEVLGGKTVVVNGVTGYEYCGVILFDKYKRIINYIESPSKNGFIEEAEISLPFNCAYIVANITLPTANRAQSNFYVYYKEELNLIDEKINNHKGELLNDIQVNTDEFIQGYYYGKEQNYVKDDRFAVSPKIYVCDDTDVIFHKFAHVNQTAVTFFDATGKLLKRIEGGSGIIIYNAVVHVPVGTSYMIYTVFVDQLSEHYVTYAKSYKSDYQINKYVGEWIKKSKLNVSSIFSKCNRPILTLIDDDAVSIDAVRAFKNACDNLGVKGTYAAVARTLEQNEELTNELLSYEKEGFHIAFHAYNQSAVSGGNGYVSFQDAVDGIRFFNSKGFLDFMYWVYPYGIAHQEEARKLGFKCGVLADNDSLETCQDGRFNLKRVEVYTDDKYPTASEIKTMIDEAVANGSWLITETHFCYGDNPVEKFNEIVQYALDAGMEVMTLNDAFRLKEPIYRLYDMF